MTDTLTPTVARAIYALAPHADSAAWATALTPYMRSSGVTTPRRIAMFLGQCSEESGQFAHIEEDLFYLDSPRIRQVWPDRFPSVAEAAPFIGHPEALACRVYAGRNGNGDEASGDGWRFRGRGLIQLTGLTIYRDFAHATGRDVDDAAEWCSTRDGAAASACWYWSWAYHGRLNGLADEWRIADVTRVINGALDGLAARVLACNRALAVIAGAPDRNAKTDANYANPIPETVTAEGEADRLMDAELLSLHPVPAEPASTGA